MSSRFTGKHRYTKISAAIGCHFCGVAVYFLLSEALFNSIYEGALASGTGDDAAYMLALENGGLIIHIVMAAIPLLLGVLYAPPERTEQEMGTPHVLVGLPANKGLLTAIGCGILVLSCVMDTQFKAYLTVSDYQDIDLFYVFIAARIARLPMVTLYGFLLDKKRWRLMVSIPLVMILLCGSIPLLFNGAAAAGIVFFLSVMGGHSFTYLLFILPVMLASRLKRPPLLNCLGPVIYLLITVFLDVTISRLNIGPVLFENKEFLFVAVVLCAAGMFFLLMEFFIRQRGLELQAEFAASLQSNIPSPNADTSTPRLPVTSGLPNVAEIAKTYMLTKREAELFPYLLSPLTAEDISRETYIAVSTTRTHISNILSKLQVPSRRELQKAFGQDVSQDVFSM